MIVVVAFGFQKMKDSTVIGVIAAMSFCIGIFVGYELKTWRIEWLKRRRERLAKKLAATQQQIDNLSERERY